jgi:hypothetical protein
LTNNRLAGRTVGSQAGVEISADILGRLVDTRWILVAVRLVPVGQILVVPVPPLPVRLRRTVPATFKMIIRNRKHLWAEVQVKMDYFLSMVSIKPVIWLFYFKISDNIPVP